MRIAATDPEGAYYHVYLNGKLIRTAVAADDEEGWVDIIDAEAAAPLIEVGTQKVEVDGEVIQAPVYLNEAKPGDPEPTESPEGSWTPIPTKRLKGEVKLVRI